jgi:hypothetical protein
LPLFRPDLPKGLANKEANMFILERATEKSFGSFDETLAFVSEEKKRLARIPIAGLWKAGARFHCARKARHLDVGEVIVFAIIGGPSELVIKVRSLWRQSVAAIVCLVVALTFPCSWGSVVIMC